MDALVIYYKLANHSMSRSELTFYALHMAAAMDISDVDHRHYIIVTSIGCKLMETDDVLCTCPERQQITRTARSHIW